MRAAARAAGLVLLAMFVAGCDDEPAQRKAFSEFLQTRIIDKPGLHVPRPTPEQSESFGLYAKDYAIIVDFNGNLDRSVAAPLQDVMKRGSIHSLNDIVAHHADIIAVRAGMAQLRAALDHELAAADAAHAALKQPDDLKAVFDKAYERDVMVPAKAFADIFPDLSQALGAVAELGEFLDQHKDKVTLNGPMVLTRDPALQPQLTAPINAVTARTEAINKAQQRLADTLRGG